MSKEKRAANKLRSELINRVRQLEARVNASAVNTLAREHFARQLTEARRQLERLN